MLRSLTVVVVLLLVLALPTAAQKADSTSEQVVRQSIETICRDWEAGIAKQDSAAVTALFTEDGIFMTPVGVLRDRQQIKTYYEGAFKQGWNNEVVTLDGMHLAGNAAWAFGEYTLSGQGPSGALSRAGRWSMVFERESDGWKIRFLIANVPCAGSSRSVKMTTDNNGVHNLGRCTRLAALICVGPAAGNFGHNDEVPLGKRIKDYPPFTDPAAKCAA